MSELWMPLVNAILAVLKRVNGRPASERTRTNVKEVVYAVFRLLHMLGYRIQHPKNLTERHVRELVKHWHYYQRKSAATIRNDLSCLRRFCRAMGKGGMIKKLEDYLDKVDPRLLTVPRVTKKSKSWAAKGIDMGEIIKKADALDVRFGLILRMLLVFGLRENEALKCDPWKHDMDTALDVPPGHAKNGRPRHIPVMGQGARDVLDFVKSKIPMGETLGWPLTRSGQVATLEQNRRRYFRLMARLGATKRGALGVTGHGLRAQFAENMAMQLGILPPTLGGTGAQASPAEMKLVLAKISEALGHSRVRVLGAYLGSFAPQESYVHERRLKTIQNALAMIEDELPMVRPERQADCEHIVKTLAGHGCELTVPQAHWFWKLWCYDRGHPWTKPKGDVVIGVEFGAVVELSGAGPELRQVPEIRDS